MIMGQEQTAYAAAAPRWGEQAARTIQLLTVPEAAARLRVSEAKVWTLVGRGDLHSVKIDASRRIPEDALAEYVAQLAAEEERARRAGAA
jgi:excisionase family DNA binding protein